LCRDAIVYNDIKRHVCLGNLGVDKIYILLFVYKCLSKHWKKKASSRAAEPTSVEKHLEVSG
jgi:hypothetical protein